MKELIDFVKKTSWPVIAVVVIGYFAKGYLDTSIEGLAARVDRIASTSLEVKKDMRGEEREELVEFRVAVEEWEYFLQGMLFDFTMGPVDDARSRVLFEKDSALYLAVRLAIVRACTYLRNQELEIELMAMVGKIRNVYYPMIHSAVPQIIEIQSALRQYEKKREFFEKSGGQNMAYAPTEHDRDAYRALQTQLTEAMQKFADALLKEYPAIADQMYDLKYGINQYIYRDITHAAISKA